MKKTLITMSALLLSAAGVNAQAFTSPVGYETHTIEPGFNMIGVRLLSPVLSNGTFSAPSGSTLPTDVADLDAVLGDDATVGMVTIEVLSGENAGLIIESDTWVNGNFTNIAGLSADLAGDGFQVRLAPTLVGLFGADNSAGLQEGDLTTADVVWVSSGGGTFERYYYAEANPDAFPVPVAAGWKTALGQDASDVSFNYIDGVFIQRRAATNLELVVSGDVKTEMVSLDVTGGNFNFYSGVYPVSTTLADTQLDTSLLHGSLTSADVVWMPSGPGTWDRFYFSEANPDAFPVPVTAGWKTALGEDASSQELTSGFIIQRRDASDIDIELNPNVVYDTL